MKPPTALKAQPWLKFAIESHPPLVSAPVGSAMVARRDTWPARKHQAIAT